jgi:hypothetical protein
MGDTETSCHAVFEFVYLIRDGLVAVSGPPWGAVKCLDPRLADRRSSVNTHPSLKFYSI